MRELSSAEINNVTGGFGGWLLPVVKTVYKISRIIIENSTPEVSDSDG